MMGKKKKEEQARTEIRRRERKNENTNRNREDRRDLPCLMVEYNNGNGEEDRRGKRGLLVSLF